MIVAMKANASETDRGAVEAALRSLGFETRTVALPYGIFVSGVGVPVRGAEPSLLSLPGVAWVNATEDSPVLGARATHPPGTRVRLGKMEVGGTDLVVMAGPCSVEDPSQITACARFAAACGASVLRGGAFKPRTSPYSFQGLGMEGLSMLREAGDLAGLPVVSEVMEPAAVEAMAPLVDCLQIGARSMQNFPLLREAGRAGKPILLKRGGGTSLKELLLAAEYVLLEGNPDVILCERGIKSFETATRNTLDLAAVPLLKSKTHLPVLVDPSHGTGRREAVLPMARAAVAAGADGLMVEVHPDPARSLSDADQTLSLAEFRALMEAVSPVAEAVGRRLPSAGRTAQGVPRRTLGWGA
jgi:3-deoxy-7-phosphoheptulonate synthase